MTTDQAAEIIRLLNNLIALITRGTAIVSVLLVLILLMSVGILVFCSLVYQEIEVEISSVEDE